MTLFDRHRPVRYTVPMTTINIAKDFVFPYVSDARSVSSLVATLQKPFDPDGSKLRRASHNKGVSQTEMQGQWDAKGAASRSLGSDLHEHIASILRDEAPDPIEGLSTRHPQNHTFNTFWKRACKIFDVVWVEKDIHSKHYNVTGRVDAMLYHTATQQHHLIDWKTGKYSTHGWDALLPPFSDLRSSSPNLGSVQLGIYRLAVEEALDIELGLSYIGFISEHSVTIRRVPDIRDRLERWLR